MGKSYSVRLPQRQEEVIEDMQDRGDADSDTEALRELIDAGMAQYGYRGRQKAETPLKQATSRFAWVFALIGLTWLATTVYLPVSLRVPAVFAFMASAGLFAFEKILESHEPGITNQLRRLYGGDEV